MKVLKPGSTVLYPVPAVVVSCGLERPNLITLAWVGTVCSEPPAVSIAVRPERFSHNLLAEAGEFVVNLPRADQVNIVDYCGSVSGRDVDKWAACGLTPVPASKIDTPLIAEFPMALECRVTQQLNLGVHDLFIGEVLAVQVDEAALNQRGQLDVELAPPLAYAGGYYYKLGQKLGRHGDWRKGIK
jgi:flavin reductase (DIM6/NTAB) family NADH-FMN oxidoreductase RutF